MGINCRVLTFDPAAVDWINSAIAEYPESTVILLFHSYMRIDGGLIADGTVAYRSIIEKNPNVKLVLAGHTRGVGRRTDSFDDDGDGTPERTVEEIVMNYQNIKRAGRAIL